MSQLHYLMNYYCCYMVMNNISLCKDHVPQHFYFLCSFLNSYYLLQNLKHYLQMYLLQSFFLHFLAFYILSSSN